MKLREILAPVPDVEAFERRQFPIQRFVRQLPRIFAIVDELSFQAFVLFVRSLVMVISFQAVTLERVRSLNRADPHLGFLLGIFRTLGRDGFPVRRLPTLDLPRPWGAPKTARAAPFWWYAFRGAMR